MNNADKLTAAMLVLIDRVQNHMEIDAESAAAGVSTDDEAAITQAREALAEHGARTFANDCHDMADRCATILRRDDEQRRTGQHDRLRDADRTALLRLRAYAHGVGDEAECSPEAFEVKP